MPVSHKQWKKFCYVYRMVCTPPILRSQVMRDQEIQQIWDSKRFEIVKKI